MIVVDPSVLTTCFLKGYTALQSMMNAKQNQQRLWPCSEIGLNKIIKLIKIKMRQNHCKLSLALMIYWRVVKWHPNLIWSRWSINSRIYYFIFFLLHGASVPFLWQIAGHRKIFPKSMPPWPYTKLQAEPSHISFLDFCKKGKEG